MKKEFNYSAITEYWNSYNEMLHIYGDKIGIIHPFKPYRPLIVKFEDGTPLIGRNRPFTKNDFMLFLGAL